MERRRDDPLQTGATEMKFHTRPLGKALIIAVSAFAALTLLAVFLYLKDAENVSPKDAVNRQYGKSAFQVAEEAASVRDSRDKTLTAYFTYSPEGKVNCCLYRKQRFRYDFLCFSGSLLPDSKNRDQSWMMSAIRGGGGGRLFWGILYDHSISGVMVGGSPANIVQAKDMKLWYSIGTDQTDLHAVTFMR